MDATWHVTLAALLGVVLGGGAVLAWHISDLRLRGTVAQTRRTVIPPEVSALLSVLPSSAVIVDSEDHVLKASAPAYAMGIVQGSELVSADLLATVAEVRRDGQIRNIKLEVESANRPVRHIDARVAVLTSYQILILAEDRTRERNVDTVRRDFVANVSHELKTPIGALRVLAEATTEAADDPEAVERFTGRMIAETERLADLVQQIIALSRLQADDPLESPDPVHLDEVVRSATDTTNVDALRKHITVTATVVRDLVVMGSADQITSAVTNLVANAIAYSDEGTRVTIAVSAMSDRALITVHDEGIGIPAAEIDRVFERFYRIDPARHRSTGGTGLGLSIVKHVAATHGGDVTVASVEGQGSTFTMALPLATPEEIS